MHLYNFEDLINKLKPYLRDYLNAKGIDTSKKFKCIYPDHTDSDPSCSFIAESNRIYCWGCKRHSDLFDVVRILENKPAGGSEWVEGVLFPLAEQYNIEVDHSALSEEEVYRLDMRRAFQYAAELIEAENIPKSYKTFHGEVKKRGWDLSVLEQLNVGTVKSSEDFQDALISKGFSRDFLKEIGLWNSYLFNPEQVIFTWKDQYGRTIGFSTRNPKYEQQKAKAEKEGTEFKEPKCNFLHPTKSGAKCNIFQKGGLLYGMDQKIVGSSIVYIFEGQADVITARHHGLSATVAIGHSKVREDHLNILQQIGVKEVILCMDGDEAGHKATLRALDGPFKDCRNLRVKVVSLPDNEDPDSYIRKNGLAAFKQLGQWTAFQWRLNQFTEETDEEEICSQVIPLIAGEPSPIAREQQAKELSTRTGISVASILSEIHLLLDTQAQKLDQERRNIVNATLNDLRRHPQEAELVLQKAYSELVQLNISGTHGSKLTNEECLQQVESQKFQEEVAPEEQGWFLLGPDLVEMEERLRGKWDDGITCFIGGKSNVGKSGLLCKLAYSLATFNSDVTVIYHTIDDTLQQIVPRFVTIAEGTKQISINMVRNPTYWKKKIENLEKKRDGGYQDIMKLIQEGRLVIKDVQHGDSLVFGASLIQYYKNKYPERRIVYILDNLHKLPDFHGLDERVRFKTISQEFKKLALSQRCLTIASVEYTKLQPGTKPTNNNIGESGQLEYDANIILHLFSEVNDLPHSFTICHKSLNLATNRETFLPRIQVIVGKNKVTEDKTPFFLDFFPACSDYRSVSQEQVLKDAKKMKEWRNGQEGEFPVTVETIGGQ